jgi:hypothetical protein
VWLPKHHPEFLPLIKAMARVIGVERDILGGQDSLNAEQFADLQSTNKIVSTSSKIQKTCKLRSQNQQPIATSVP